MRQAHDDVELTERQRELLKGNERLLSQKEIVWPRFHTRPQNACVQARSGHFLHDHLLTPRRPAAGTLTNADGGGPGPCARLLGRGGHP